MLALFTGQAVDTQQARDTPTNIWQSHPIEIAGGRLLVLCPKKPVPLNSDSVDLLIHFHGAPQTCGAAMAKSGLRCVVALLNFNGLSDAYVLMLKLRSEVLAEQ